jgi:hypothetical protein
MDVPEAIDPGRRSFFAAGFLDEPDIDWQEGSGPY